MKSVALGKTTRSFHGKTVSTAASLTRPLHAVEEEAVTAVYSFIMMREIIGIKW